MEAKEQSIFSFQMLPLTVRFFVVNKTARYRQLTAGVGNLLRFILDDGEESV
jgi:hypothetical protein